MPHHIFSSSQYCTLSFCPSEGEAGFGAAVAAPAADGAPAGFRDLAAERAALQEDGGADAEQSLIEKRWMSKTMPVPGSFMSVSPGQ